MFPAQPNLFYRTVFLNTRAAEEQALTFELGIQNDGAHWSLVCKYGCLPVRWSFAHFADRAPTCVQW